MTSQPRSRSQSSTGVRSSGYQRSSKSVISALTSSAAAALMRCMSSRWRCTRSGVGETLGGHVGREPAAPTLSESSARTTGPGPARAGTERAPRPTNGGPWRRQIPASCSAFGQSWRRSIGTFTSCAVGWAPCSRSGVDLKSSTLGWSSS